jgi:hypothetical protein
MSRGKIKNSVIISDGGRWPWRSARVFPAAYTHLQSQRDCILQSRFGGIARAELPWENIVLTLTTRTGVAPVFAVPPSHNPVGVAG